MLALALALVAGEGSVAAQSAPPPPVTSAPDAELEPGPIPTGAPAAGTPPGDSEPTPSDASHPEPSDVDEDADDAGDEDASPFSFAAEASVVSTYVWRGDRIHDSAFEPAFWAWAEAVYDAGRRGTFTVGFWGSIPFQRQVSTVPEIDPYLIYDVPLGPLRFNVLFYAFLQPQVQQEGGLLGTGYTIVSSLRWADLPVVPTIGFGIDPFVLHDLYPYVQLAASWSRDAWSFDAWTRLGFSSGYDDAAFTTLGFQDWTTSLALTYALPRGAWLAFETQLIYGGRPDIKFTPTARIAIGWAWPG